MNINLNLHRHFFIKLIKIVCRNAIENFQRLINMKFK